MVSPRRVVAVTLGLVGIGAILGAIAGAAAFTVASAPSLLTDGIQGFGGDLLFASLFFGVPLGAISAPVLAWALLRRVPLGRMFVWSVAGTVVGGVAGWITSSWAVLGDNSLERAINFGVAGAFIGCVVACILLRYRAFPRPMPDG